jgi:hypothetical protein
LLFKLALGWTKDLQYDSFCPSVHSVVEKRTCENASGVLLQKHAKKGKAEANLGSSSSFDQVEWIENEDLDTSMLQEPLKPLKLFSLLPASRLISQAHGFFFGLTFIITFNIVNRKIC